MKAQEPCRALPKLKDGWTQALALQNQLLVLASNIVEKEQALARPQLIGESREQLNQLVGWRRKLEERFQDMPMTFDQYEDRERRVDERFVDLKRQAFILSQRLKEVRKTVIALERYVDDQRFKDGQPRFSEAEESELQTSTKKRFSEVVDG